MKKKILILATGGTLACIKSDHGLSPGLSRDDILSYISDITEFYEVDFKELFQLDSANIHPDNWVTMAEAIYSEYKNYHGIVIFHGTDTMAYTASALSFMLPNISIPVVITGSQLSIANPLADAVENCRCAIHMAGSGVAGIFLAFDRKVMLGTRASKVRTRSFHAFESINYPYAGEVDSAGLVIRKASIPVPKGECRLYTNLDQKVFLIKLVPGFDDQMFRFFLKQGYKALIIESFGMGGIPTISPKILQEIHYVIEQGMMVVVKSQCLYEGSNLSIYETGQESLKAGVLQGFDMTTEALVTKLMWLLGQDLTKEERIAKFYENIAGEITVPGQGHGPVTLL